MKVEEYKGLLLKPMSRSKYRNVPTEADGFRFDSKRESLRWLELRQMERAGLITDLKRQVTFPLVLNGELLCRYIADFTYMQNGKEITEDSKGVRTDLYRLKKKLMKALHKIDILET